jgi:hypothetical protein
VSNWFPTLSLRRFPEPLRLVLLADVIVVPLLGIIGSISLARSRGAARLLGSAALVAAAYFTLSSGWFISQSRLTVPIRLILVLSAAAFVAKLLGGRRNAESRSSEGERPDADSQDVFQIGRDLEPVERAAISHL